jgi:hypothetical protein
MTLVQGYDYNQFTIDESWMKWSQIIL